MSADAAGNASSPAHAGLSYTLPAATGTVWLGLDATSLTGLAVTMAATVALMLNGAALWLSVLVAVAGASMSAWPLAGRTALRWLPAGTTHLSRRSRQRDGWTAALDDRASDLPGRLRLPKECGPVSLHDPGDGNPALLEDCARRTVTVILDVTGTGRFGLLDPTAQDSDLARWGSCLAGLTALPGLRHLQWLTHTRPDTTQPADLDQAAARNRLLADQAQLVHQVRGLALRHTHLLALTLDARAARARAGGDPDQLPEAVRDTVRAACARLLAADLLACPVTARELPPLLRLLLDPSLPLAQDGAAAANGPVLLSRRNAWTACRTDDSLHRAHAVTGWPRLSLPADWLAPLLHHLPLTGTARTLTVHARPVRPEQAARRARAAAAKARLDAHDLQRLGFTASTGHALDEHDATQTEAELAAGYPMSEVSALLTVHARSSTALESAARDLTAWAVSQRIDLRALHGQHQHALAATLPLGRVPGGRR